MKNNTPYSTLDLIEYTIVAIALVLTTAIAKAKAQDNLPEIPNSSPALNGVFTPTAAERFFEEGREDFEDEIDFLNNSDDYLNGDLLLFDKELIEQIQETKPLPDSELNKA